MALQISPEQMEQYKRTARARWQTDRQRQDARRERARQLVHQAAEMLKREYGAHRIVLFGSLTHPDRFTQWSDVDLAAWGLTPANWLRAIGAVRALSNEVELNLVDIECCSPELLAAIERDGVPL